MKSRSRWWMALLYSSVGGVSGAVLGYIQQCAGGTCPLMCAWWRGALFGGVAGLLIWASGRWGKPPVANDQPGQQEENPR